MAALLPVVRIKRDNGCGAASLAVEQANMHKELLLLMPQWATRGLLDRPLPCSRSMAGWPCPQPWCWGKVLGARSSVFPTCCPLSTTGKQ